MLFCCLLYFRFLPMLVQLFDLLAAISVRIMQSIRPRETHRKNAEDASLFGKALGRLAIPLQDALLIQSFRIFPALSSIVIAPLHFLFVANGGK